MEIVSCTVKLLILTVFFAYCFHNAIALSSISLTAGLQISLLDSFSETGHYKPNLSENNRNNAAISFSVAVPTNESGSFFPILSSNDFVNKTILQLGYALGFLFLPHKGDTGYGGSGQAASDIYLSICIGKFGSLIVDFGIELYGISDDKNHHIKPNSTFDGIAMPIWIANLDDPITSANVSLVVSNEGTLELLGTYGSGPWSVPGILNNVMEMKDKGNLVIYGTEDMQDIRWQSFEYMKDILLPDQELKSGNSLNSASKLFTLTMQPGGLVFYYNSNSVQVPYWVIPITKNWTHPTLSPCSDNDPSSASWSSKFSALILMPGACLNSMYQTSIFPRYSSSKVDLLKFENDGRLYLYSIYPDISSVYRSSDGLDFGNIVWVVIDKKNEKRPASTILTDNPYNIWGSCDSPIACGGLGICTPDADKMCSCPHMSSDQDNKQHFIAVNREDMSKGCRTTNLSCIANNSSFITLNGTTSISLLSGLWTDAKKNVDECKSSCLLDCSCVGFVYDQTSSICMPLTDNVSLLNVSNHRKNDKLASNYVTYLKVPAEAGDNRYSWLNLKTILIGAGSIITVAFCLIVALLIIMTRKAYRRALAPDLDEDETDLKDILPLLPNRFSYQDLHEATQAFRNLLGAGGCGSVYAGILPDGRNVAVKRLGSLSSTAQSRSFLAEVVTISRTSHHNIVRLVGFCWEHSNRLLVYEYIERGSLDQWLFQGTDFAYDRVLGWSTRYNIALGLARGLKYLHDDCPQPILHLDIKPQNILLDKTFVAKLADFGMSRLMERDISHVVTGVRGTPGYIAPKWNMHGGVSKKSDVYSTGMVLLELVGGRRNVNISLLDTEVCDRWHFPSWAAMLCQEGRMMEMLDPRLQRELVNEEQVRRLIYVAFWCIQEDPRFRPDISTVVQWLEERCRVEEPPFSMASHINSVRSKPLSFPYTSSASDFLFTSSSTSGF